MRVMIQMGVNRSLCQGSRSERLRGGVLTMRRCTNLRLRLPLCRVLFARLFLRLDSLNIAWTDMSRDAVVYLVTSLPPTVTRLNLSGCRDTLHDEGKY